MKATPKGPSYSWRDTKHQEEGELRETKEEGEIDPQGDFILGSLEAKKEPER